ncbi:MAG: FAD-dependent oxidoreductase, partial [Gemmatimonadaceae bacterium]|nr:FAD-dependent oxidoreductase [Gemmatimonadaceae bacterium]
MARTPLFTVLRRSLRLAQHANVSGEPADSATDRWRESTRMSRRTFVAGGTVVAAGLATGCAPASRRPSPAPRQARADDEPIVIVGAGIAGLTCAYRLRAAGLPVRVMEAQSRTGGRMYSLRNHFADGQVCELG